MKPRPRRHRRPARAAAVAARVRPLPELPRFRLTFARETTGRADPYPLINRPSIAGAVLWNRFETSDSTPKRSSRSTSTPTAA